MHPNEQYKSRAIDRDYWSQFIDVFQQYEELGAIEDDPDLTSNHEYFLPTKASRILIMKRTLFPSSTKPVIDPKDAQLPTDRVNITRPFAAVGIDYAGRLKVKSADGVTSVTDVYILLMVCTSTRALKCYVTDSLSTEELLLAFRNLA